VLKRATISGLVIALAFVVAYLNRYKYFRIGRGDGIELEFRTNRFTNETDALDNHGWRVVQTPDDWRTLHWNATHPPHIASFDDIVPTPAK